MDEAAKKLHNDLSRFANTLSGEHHVLKESLSKAAQELAEAFDVQPKASVGKIASLRKMQVQRAYYKKKCESLAKQLKDASGVKSHGLLNRMWLVRASLGDPTVAPRSLEQFCREFHDVEVSTISATSIAAGRDCFAELIKLNTGHIIADAVSRMDAATDEASKPVILCHIHDEAALRLRSFDASLGERLIRARSSKIQNHAMTLQAGMETYEIFTEAKPEQKKQKETTEPKVQPQAGNAVPESAKPSDEQAAPELAVGDIVMTSSKKFKDSLNEQKGKIVGILAKQYKIDMMTGSSKGEVKKFDKAAVRKYGEPSANGPKDPGQQAAGTEAAPKGAADGDKKRVAEAVPETDAKRRASEAKAAELFGNLNEIE